MVPILEAVFGNKTAVCVLLFIQNYGSGHLSQVNGLDVLTAAAAKVYPQIIFIFCSQIAQIFSVFVFTKRAAKTKVGPGGFT